MISNYGNIENADTLKERRAALSEIYTQIYSIVGDIDRIGNMVFGTRHKYFWERDNEICERILSQQLANADRRGQYS